MNFIYFLGVNTKPQIPNQILDNMRQEAEEKMIYYEDEVLSAAVSKSSIKVHNLLNSYSFAKEYLLDIKVLKLKNCGLIKIFVCEF